MKYILAACIALFATSSYALTFSDIGDALKGAGDAISGHTTDLVDRWSHEDTHIDGLDVSTSSIRTDDIGQDSFHWAEGDISLVFAKNDFFIQLEDNFKAGHAPDLYIYIADRMVEDEDSFMNAEVEELGKLVSGSGASFYEVKDEDVITDKHIEVVIWCKRFSEFMGAATLRKES